MASATKQRTVEKLMRELKDDLSHKSLSDPRRQEALEQLKIHGRDPTGADAIYCQSGITTLTKYAFGEYASTVVQEALKVIANALLLQQRLQAVLIGLDGVLNVARLYKNQTDDFEFLGGRILFLCTYTAHADLRSAFEAGLLDSIETHLSRHAAQASPPRAASSPMENMAIAETTKLIYNLNDKHPEECKQLNASVPDLCRILPIPASTQAPLDPPVGAILNALACLDFGAVPAGSQTTEPTSESLEIAPKLMKILDMTTQFYKSMQLDTNALSILTVLRMLYDTSSSGVQEQMRKALLPADSERDLPLGKSSSLASRLLQLTTAPGLMHLPEAISSLMFEMSNKDPTLFIKNIGYGYAAGYLMSHKIPIPESIENTSIDTAANEVPINPVTGQRLDKEIVPDVPEMTPEEKEREAERLFVLFDRLKATGVVDTENPVRLAMAQGRLKEISDSDED